MIVPHQAIEITGANALGDLFPLGTLVTVAITSLGVGVGIGIAIGNKKISSEWWAIVKKRCAERRDPHMICPHVNVEQDDEGETTVQA